MTTRQTQEKVLHVRQLVDIPVGGGIQHHVAGMQVSVG